MVVMRAAPPIYFSFELIVPIIWCVFGMRIEIGTGWCWVVRGL